MKIALAAVAAAMFVITTHAQDVPPAPDVNKVIEDLAAIGPETLLNRVKELKAAEAGLKGEADTLRQQAEQKDAEAAAMRARISAVETFTAQLAAAMTPPVETAPAAPVEAAPAPTEPVVIPAEAAAAPAEPAPVVAEAAAVPAEPAAAPAGAPASMDAPAMDNSMNSMGMMAPPADNQM